MSFGLYLHWPFCRSKCPYCDFNSHVAASIDQERWRCAYEAELAHYAARTPGRRVDTVFFGGGTPSLMAPATVAALLERIAGLWTLDPGAEITLEANPTSAETVALSGFRAAGVNRLSLGVQALDDAALHRLGRAHDAAEARRAMKLAERLFPRWSFDLITARPDQSVAAWRQELRQAVALAGGHLSVYQLTIEPGTGFAPLAERGALVLPDEESAAALFEVTQEVLEAAGLPAYEISNHARPGEECRHNLLYWQSGDYAGIGPGAHGRLTLDGTVWATQGERSPGQWLEQVEHSGCGGMPPEAVTPRERRIERLLMGLRLTQGIARDDGSGDILAGLDHTALDRLCAAGFLTLSPGHIAATTAGRQRLNAVLAQLL